MKLFDRFRKGGGSASRALIKRLDGKAIKYVTERRGDLPETSGGCDDTVIGRSGSLIIKGNELLVYSSADVVFRADLSALTASELLSGDGVILSGEDIEHGGVYREIIAYYTYYL